MKKIIALAFFANLASYPPQLIADENIVQILALSQSLVQITTEIPGGNNGRGSGVVIDQQYVATNCHVIANANGVSIAKYQTAYTPIAIKADWKHDLCLLKFTDLPFPPVNIRDSGTLKIEESTISLGYPSGFNVPQPSYGNIKATYALDGSRIIRTDAAFSLGSSGGALFDRDSNLIGITTFKSPGAKGYYYNLPADWISKLIQEGPELDSLKTMEIPFWALPLEERPYFMQVVIPYQNQEWPLLKTIAQKWIAAEPNTAEGWYYLGVAEAAQQETDAADLHLTKAHELNHDSIEVMIALSNIAYTKHDLLRMEQLKQAVGMTDQAQADAIDKKMLELK